MKVGSIQNNYNLQSPRNKQVAFKSWTREVFKTPKKTLIQELKHRNDTSFVRGGYFWQHLAYYLLYKYNKTAKVNVYDYGCSDGSEPYTFLMSLIATYGFENAEKFLPIKARDYDPIAIEKAKEGIFN